MVIHNDAYGPVRALGFSWYRSIDFQTVSISNLDRDFLYIQEIVMNEQVIEDELVIEQEEFQNIEYTSIERELSAMKTILTLLKELNRDSAERVLSWAVETFNIQPKAAMKNVQSGTTVGSIDNDFNDEELDLAEFYSVLSPKTDADKALTVAYWLQVNNSSDSIDSFSINKELKNLGYGVGNITRAFDNLMKMKPQPIIQTRKDGTSKQARKSYRVTEAGKKYIQNLLKNSKDLQ